MARIGPLRCTERSLTLPFFHSISEAVTLDGKLSVEIKLALHRSSPEKPLDITDTSLLQARCPSYHPINGAKALKDVISLQVHVMKLLLWTHVKHSVSERFLKGFGTAKYKQQSTDFTLFDLDWSQDCRDIVSWTPSVLQDVEANASISIHCYTHTNSRYSLSLSHSFSVLTPIF